MRSRVRAAVLPTLFFLLFFLFRICGRQKTPHLRKADLFFCQKMLRIFLKLYYINCRYDRRFTDHLHPPHFRQTSLNYGSLGKNVEIEKRLFAQYDERKRRFRRKNSNDAKKCGKWSGGAEKKEVCWRGKGNILGTFLRAEKERNGRWVGAKLIFFHLFFLGAKSKKNPNTIEELKTFYLKKE